MKKEIQFSEFWDAYGLKLDKQGAMRAWKRLSVRDKKAALDGIEAYRAECLRRGISRMYPQGYLSHRRWEDEISPENETREESPKDGGTAASEPKEMSLW